MTTSPERPVNTSGLIRASLSDGTSPTPVKLTHGSGSNRRTLVLQNGINDIEWHYELITNLTSTYGGEVIQILGASIGPIKLSGNTRSAYELEQIRQWFVGVMTALGTGNREREDAVLLEYPERGWSFWIMPIGFGPWQLGNEVVAAEWYLTAEMVSKTSNVLSDHTMATQVGLPDSSKLAERAFDHWRRIFEPGYQAEITHDGSTKATRGKSPGGGNESATEVIDTSGNFLDAAQAATHKASVDKTFAALVTGDLSLFAGGSSEKEADDSYIEGFGDKWLVPPGGVGSGSSLGEGAVDGAGGGSLDGAKVKGVAATAAQKECIRIILERGKAANARTKALIAAIMAATQESTMTAASGAGGSHVGLFQMDSAKGSQTQRQNPTFASNWWFSVAVPYDTANRNVTKAELAEAVEISGQGSLYAQWEEEATNTVNLWLAGGGDTAGVGGGGASDPTDPNKPIQATTHRTEGLDGFPACDYFAATGSPCYSPVTGVVTKLSGRPVSAGWSNRPGSAFGQSCYIYGGGKTYYLTHMDERTVAVGDQVRRGQKIGTLAPLTEHGNNSHIHMSSTKAGSHDRRQQIPKCPSCQ